LHSTQDERERNLSEKSNILAPFNSTQSEGSNEREAEKEAERQKYEDSENIEKPNVEVHDNAWEDDYLWKKEDCLIFKPRAKRADIAYERNHNRDVDNGVY